MAGYVEVLEEVAEKKLCCQMISSDDEHWTSSASE